MLHVLELFFRQNTCLTFSF
uniref:Uncharacterized protein n=1 Tax=Arundo donax TaxID=35708 RepID=A0A0A9CE89_ARUDO